MGIDFLDSIYDDPGNVDPQPPNAAEAWDAGPSGAVESLRRAGWSLEVPLGAERLTCRLWTDQKLASPFCLDVETEMVIGPPVPHLALATAASGNGDVVVVLPEDLASFIVHHADAHIVCHNASFDFRVIRQHLADVAAQDTWLQMCDRGQVHCSMMLAMLVDIAKFDDTNRFRYDLGTLAERYCGVTVDKSDSYRSRYGELLGHDWNEPVETGFLMYAARDPHVTIQLWRELTSDAAAVCRHHRINGRLVKQLGYLTEIIQTRASIALADCHTRGVTLDREQVAAVRQKLEQRAREQVDLLAAMAPHTFSRKQDGSYRYPGKCDERRIVPSRCQQPQRERLQRFSDEHGLQPPTTETGKLTLSTKYWAQFQEDDEYIRAWVEMEGAAKLLSFFRKLNAAVIHPRYRTLVRTGRTSCSDPNIQQLPRSGGFREMVAAPEGKVLFCLDYSAIELVTLAHVCYQRFGHSKLRDVINQGIDPHVFTASLLEGCSLEEFHQLPNRKELRQRAKAVNFGIPGGLSASTLVTYAKQTYGVELPLFQAEEFRSRLIDEVFPELREFLVSRPDVEILADNLGISTDDVHEVFDETWHLPVLRRICNGEHCKASNGEPYAEDMIRAMHDGLAQMDVNGRWTEPIEAEDSKQLKRLFWDSVATLSGRVRGAVPYTAERNCQFQGLAADGAKAALWQLYRQGFELVAFVHDEFLLQWDEGADHSALAARVKQICVSAMQPFCGDVKVSVEYALSKTWHKDAEEVRDHDGHLLIWKPKALDPRTTVATQTPPEQTDDRKSPPETATEPPNLELLYEEPRIYCGDCLTVGRALYAAGERFDFVFGDPPFNIGHGYVTYDDNMSPQQFASFMVEWLHLGQSLLTPNGLLGMHGPDALLYIAIRNMPDPVHYINWYYRFGQSGAVKNATRCTNQREHLLLWRKASDVSTTFNPPLVPSDRATKYNDKRTRTTQTPGMKVAGNVWGVDEPYFGRVQGNNNERWDKQNGALLDHPNQLPERYVKRIIETFSNPASRVLIMFGGSGTETVISHALGRQTTAIELGEVECQSIVKRLQRGPVRL